VPDQSPRAFLIGLLQTAYATAAQHPRLNLHPLVARAPAAWAASFLLFLNLRNRCRGLSTLFSLKMKNPRLKAHQTKMLGGVLSAALAPSAAWACACGCGVFDVATSSMFPSGPGEMVFLNYYYQDQDRNWSGTSQAPAANNSDKEIETHFFSLGLQHMFNYSWGIQAEVPYDYRTFRTTDNAGNLVTRHWSQLGDIRIRGIYTGFSEDFSSGVTFGVKLPTGSYSFEPDIVDRDTQLGTGSTDILLGGFYRNNLTKNGKLDWFAQAELDLPILTQDQYHPGLELDAAAGIYYKGLSLGPVKIVPVAQTIFTERTSDSGAKAAHPVASGYQRLLLSPGVEFDFSHFRLYADAEFPVYQNFTGNQLAATVLFKVYCELHVLVAGVRYSCAPA